MPETERTNGFDVEYMFPPDSLHASVRMQSSGKVEDSVSRFRWTQKGWIICSKYYSVCGEIPTPRSIFLVAEF